MRSFIVELGRLVVTGNRPSETLPRLLEPIVRYADATGGAIFLVDLRTGMLELACPPTSIELPNLRPVWIRNQLQYLLDRNSQLESNQPRSAMTFCAAEQRALRNDRDQAADWSHLVADSSMTAVLIPILRVDICLGMILLVGVSDPGVAESPELAAAAQVVGAVYDQRSQFRLHGEMQRPLDLRMSNAEFFESVVELLVRSAGMEFVAIRRLEPDGRTLKTLKLGGFGKADDLSYTNIDLHQDQGKPFREAIASGSAISVDSVDLFGHKALRDFAPAVESFVVAPILLGRNWIYESPSEAFNMQPESDSERGRVFGTLSLGARVEFQYSPIERLGLTTLSHGVGLAIENYWNVDRSAHLLEQRVEAAAALQAQELAQGYRHELRKKLDNVRGVFAAVSASTPASDLEPEVEAAVASAVEVLEEWKRSSKGGKYTFDWFSLEGMWNEAVAQNRFRLRQLDIDSTVRGNARVKIHCSSLHFMRFVLSSMIMNSTDAFQERPSRHNRQISLNVIGSRGDSFVFRIADTAGGLRQDRVRAVSRRSAAWSNVQVNQVVFERGFTTKAEDQSGVGGGYGLYLARSTLGDLDGGIALVETGEPGAVFEVSLPLSRVRM